MRRILYSLIALSILTALRAEEITMDLTTATDTLAKPIAYSTGYGDGFYDLTDVWVDTYNDQASCQYIYTNDARFMLSHMPSQNSYGGQSWEGFTLSRVAQDTANVFGCVANGGVSGEGTPYVVGYFSDWVTASQGYSSNIILFDEAYYPEQIYVCQNSNTMEAITNGGVFGARAFTDRDTLSLIISGLDSLLQETRSITYYLAVDGMKNSQWTEVPLSQLGRAHGLSFRMSTTDQSAWGANTPLYFAIDALTVSTEPLTDVQDVYVAPAQQPRKVLRKGRLYIVHQEQVYTISGQRVGKGK